MKRLTAGLFTALLLALPAIPAGASNAGDVWLTNSSTAGAGHAHEPHLDCGTIYMHGSDLARSGSYTIDSIPPSGSGKQVWSGSWATPASGDVITTFNAADLIAAAVAQDSATPNPNQGYHFKLTLSQEGVKHKVFWIRCSEVRPQPSLTISKTADAPEVTAGSDIGFTVTVGVGEDGFADGVILSDPLPQGTDLNWSISPAYGGPGSCSISGTAPALQTLSCSFGDLGDPQANALSATVHVLSHTTAATAALESVTFHNTATATAPEDELDPVHASAKTTVDPAAPALAIVKTADQSSITAGTQSGFSVVVANNGPGIARSATMQDALPGATGISWSVSPAYSGPGTCTITGTAPSQSLSCALGNLASGASAAVHVVSATPAGAILTLDNVATAQADNNPAVTATAQVVTKVPGPGAPNLTITKTPDAVTATAGSNVGFTIAVANTGGALAGNASLNDALPPIAGSNWVMSPAYAGPGSCSVTGSAPSQFLACHFGDLAAGQSVSVHVTSPTAPTAIGTLTNVATAVADNNPAVSAKAQVLVVAPPSVLGTQVLGLRVTRPATALPVTGNPPMWLLAPAVVLLGIGAEVVYLARRRAAAAGPR